MKKILLLGGTGILAVLAIAFGPTLLDAYRLLAYVDESAVAYEANGGPWPQLADTCAGCHGINGNSLHQAYPGLAGQPASYVAAQLKRFSSGERANPTMTPLAMTLNADEVQQLAEHFARQAVEPNRWLEAKPEIGERGGQLVAERGCAACHGENMMGRDQNPRLAAQGSDYLVAQLNAFADGSRADPTGAMNALVAAIPAEDRAAIAQHLAKLAPAK